MRPAGACVPSAWNTSRILITRTTSASAALSPIGPR
ncbi:hypothetical protein GBAR_LOCUS29599 [Geodia barretti]|nr:hypothetical protein GBAR_LOCUS29599 [Geodia barretti]